MMRLLVVASLLILSSFIASGDEIANSGAVTEAIPLLLWAAADPKEDCQAAKIDAAKFYQFTEKYREDFLKYYNSFNIIGATKFLKDHADESGTKGVHWVFVFGKILEKKVTGQSEEKEHGLPSLVAWAVRNTGPGTKLTSVKRETLVSFLLAHKTDILKYQHAGDVKFLESTKPVLMSIGRLSSMSLRITDNCSSLNVVFSTFDYVTISKNDLIQQFYQLLVLKM